MTPLNIFTRHKVVLTIYNKNIAITSDLNYHNICYYIYIFQNWKHRFIYFV